jgi:outer membrane protein OmpA-like peptidoglycan-associated protein
MFREGHNIGAIRLKSQKQNGEANCMNKKQRTTVLSLLAVSFLVTVSAFSAAQNVKVKGMISGRTGETLILTTADGNATVILDDATKVQQPKGLGLRKKQVSAAVLIPGLKVSVDGTGDPTKITAKTITFDGSDLETAQMIQAGLHPTAEQVAANQQAIATNKEDIATNKQDIAANQQATATNAQNIATNKDAIQKNIDDIEANTKRFSELGDYDLKGQGTINFKPGSSKIAAEDQARLDSLAQKAKDQTGYIIEVMGYADSSGNAAMNTRLSEARAQAVIDYLVQHGVPIRHITAPGAYGESNAVASNETASGRAENRRVEIKVLVNKGIKGS